VTTHRGTVVADSGVAERSEPQLPKPCRDACVILTAANRGCDRTSVTGSYIHSDGSLNQFMCYKYLMDNDRPVTQVDPSVFINRQGNSKR